MSTEPIYIALATPVTGGGADYGKLQSAGANLAVEQINKAGGVNGRKVELVIKDDRLDTKEAANVAKALCADSKVVAVIGHLSSQTSFTAGPIYQECGLPMIVSLASNPKIPDMGTFVFQNSVTQSYEAADGARLLVNGLSAKKLALIYVNDDWGNSLKDIFVDTVKKLGGELVAVETYNPGEKEFNAVLTKVKQANPQGIYLGSFFMEGALIVSQARGGGMTIPIALSMGAQTDQFLEVAGKSAEGVIFTSSFHPTQPDSAVQKYVKAFRDKFNKDPGPYETLVYDSVYLIAEAIKNKGATRTGVRDGLSAIKDFPTVHGKLTDMGNGFFGPRNMIATKVQNGKYEYFREIPR